MSRRRKRKKRRKKLAYGVTAVAFIFLCFLIYFSLHQSNQASDGDGNATPPGVQAAIVDHLNFTGQSNPTFVDTCIDFLESGGLTWAYYKGEDVTVDFYRDLPSYGTSLIILRVHSAIMRTENETISVLGLFTSERYLGTEDAINKYPDDVAHERIVEAFFSEEERAQNISYFGVIPKFIRESVNGKFNKTIIIMMGCEGLGYDGLPYTDMAEAFINKGAKVYIGWDGPVGVNHTDQETLDLLQSLILEKRTIKEAVEEVDVDPDYKSELEFYPGGARNYVIPNLTSSLTMNVAYTPPVPKALKRTKCLAPSRKRF